MLGWDDELMELTPQKQEEREIQEQKQHKKDIVRGRKILRGMLVLFAVLQVFSMIFGYLAVSEEKQMGNYIFQCMVRAAAVVVLLCGLWRGQERMRIVFAVFLVLAMLSKGKEIIKLLLLKEPPPIVSWSIDEDTLELGDRAGIKSLFDYTEEQEAAMAEYREWEKGRAAYRKRLAMAHFADLMLCAGCLYVLYGCHPVKEYFDEQKGNAPGKGFLDGGYFGGKY